MGLWTFITVGSFMLARATGLRVHAGPWILRMLVMTLFTVAAFLVALTLRVLFETRNTVDVAVPVSIEMERYLRFLSPERQRSFGEPLSIAIQILASAFATGLVTPAVLSVAEWFFHLTQRRLREEGAGS